MKQNLYFRQAMRRDNDLKNAMFGFALTICSYPKMLLEVFIRKNFGQRYFSLAAGITAFVFLAVLPIGTHALSSIIQSRLSMGYGGFYHQDESSGFWLHYGTWYLFLFAFLYFTWKRYREIRTQPGTFDFARYSLSTGDINPVFFNFHPLGLRPSVRSVEVYYEPAAFFIIGIVLTFLGQRLGSLLMVSSIFYGLSYAGAYKKGTDFILDKIDEIILNEDLEDAFINDNVNPSRGARYYMDRPDDISLRRKLKGSIIVDGPADEEPTFAE